MKPPGPGKVLGRLLIHNSIYLIGIGISKLFVSPVVSFDSLCLSEN